MCFDINESWVPDFTIDSNWNYEILYKNRKLIVQDRKQKHEQKT